MRIHDFLRDPSIRCDPPNRQSHQNRFVPSKLNRGDLLIAAFECVSPGLRNRSTIRVQNFNALRTCAFSQSFADLEFKKFRNPVCHCIRLRKAIVR